MFLPNELLLEDGTLVKKCRTTKPLYCSWDGVFYTPRVSTLEEKIYLRQVKPCLSQVGVRKCTTSNNTGSHYPHMSDYGGQQCHKLVAEAWLGPRPEGMQIDHLNGDIMDWRGTNLEYVTPAENRRRAGILRFLRSMGLDPKQMTRTELQTHFFNFQFHDSL